MSQYTVGAPVKRPVLEILKNPLFDQIRLPTTASYSSQAYFAGPIGSADTTAINGATKSFSDTNLRRAGALATPQQFEIFAVSMKYADACSRADFRLIHNAGNVNLEIGQKSYLRVRCASIPGDTSPVVNSLAAAADSVGNGWSIHSNVFDVSIAEELFDEGSGRVFLTGRRVPIFLPSEQQFGLTLEFPGGITLGATTRVEFMLWGNLKREVQ